MSELAGAVFRTITEMISTTMGLVFYYVLFRLLIGRLPRRQKEVGAYEHVYYPKRFYVPALKVASIYLSFMITVISLRLWLQRFWDGGQYVGIASLLLGVIAFVIPFQKKVNRVVVNKEGLTLEYRAGGSAHYAPEQYADCQNKRLYFEDASGSRKAVQLGFLYSEDMYAVAQDMSVLKQTGKLLAGAATKADEAQRKANQEYLEEKQKLYADTARYDAYLKEEAAKRLTPAQVQELEQILRDGDKINAIKRCREWTGLGLKEAKDMVDRYQDNLQKNEAVGYHWESVAENGYRDSLAAGGMMGQNRESLAKSGYRESLASQEKSVLSAQEDKLPAQEKNVSWKWRITGREQDFSEQNSLEGVLDQLLSDLSMRREESIALAPSSPIQGIACVRASLDPQGIMFRMEVVTTERDAKGNAKILFKNGLMSWDVRDIFVSFKKGAGVQTDGWQQVRA